MGLANKLAGLFNGKLEFSVAFNPVDFKTRERIPDENDVLASMINAHGVEVVLDIGANLGQFASGLRNGGYRNQIISFEPVTETHNGLLQAAAGDSKWTVAPRCAVGDANSTTTINIAKKRAASSLLPMSDLTTHSSPNSAYVASENVDVITLDSCSLIDHSKRLFLKADTQGFEEHVLNGATETLKSTIGLQLEVLTAPLYANQASFQKMHSKLAALGFGIWNILPVFSDGTSHRLLAADVTFFKPRIG
jgi:FkbM family methyltransferase